jgi:cold shock CspA family protein
MRYEGLVTTFFPDRQFGFLDVLGRTVFFHASAYPLGVLPKVGQRVTFELGEPVKLGKPKQAVNITPLPEVETVGGVSS